MPVPDDEPSAALSNAPLGDRAAAFLVDLCRRTSHVAAWLTVRDPQLEVAGLLASVGLDAPATEMLDRPATTDVLVGGRPDVRAREVSWGPLPSDVTRSAFRGSRHDGSGFDGGVGATLRDADGLPVGYLGLLHRGATPPERDVRQHVGRLTPVLLRDLSLRRSVLDAARLVPLAESGVALLPGRTTRPLPGMPLHPSLGARTPAVALAHRGLTTGPVSHAFLWPAPGGSHARFTVVSTQEVAPFVCGVLMLTPDADCHGLTPRELEVLGLLVSGRSNQQIATRLAVAPRTVATHVEHVLRKLRAPSRTLAAVRAERLGLFVPPAPRVGRER